jgi:hypothetical protein
VRTADVIEPTLTLFVVEGGARRHARRLLERLLAEHQVGRVLLSTVRRHLSTA